MTDPVKQAHLPLQTNTIQLSLPSKLRRHDSREHRPPAEPQKSTNQCGGIISPAAGLSLIKPCRKWCTHFKEKVLGVRSHLTADGHRKPCIPGRHYRYKTKALNNTNLTFTAQNYLSKLWIKQLSECFTLKYYQLQISRESLLLVNKSKIISVLQENT